MAERSFVEEVKKLRLGAGERFRGEGILAVTKALLESGVSYVGGYQGAPISHLMDVLADAQDILAEHGIRFENSASAPVSSTPASVTVWTSRCRSSSDKGGIGSEVMSRLDILCSVWPIAPHSAVFRPGSNDQSGPAEGSGRSAQSRVTNNPPVPQVA